MPMWGFACMSMWGFACMSMWGFACMSMWGFACMSMWGFACMPMWGFACRDLAWDYPGLEVLVNAFSDSDIVCPCGGPNWPDLGIR